VLKKSNADKKAKEKIKKLIKDKKGDKSPVFSDPNEITYGEQKIN